MIKKNKIGGITLIETLIYIGLLGILMTGVFSSVYAVIRSENHEDWIDKDAQLLQKQYYE